MATAWHGEESGWSILAQVLDLAVGLRFLDIPSYCPAIRLLHICIDSFLMTVMHGSISSGRLLDVQRRVTDSGRRNQASQSDSSA